MKVIAGIVVLVVAIIGLMLGSIDRDTDPINGDRQSITERIEDLVE